MLRLDQILAKLEGRRQRLRGVGRLAIGLEVEGELFVPQHVCVPQALRGVAEDAEVITIKCLNRDVTRLVRPKRVQVQVRLLRRLAIKNLGHADTHGKRARRPSLIQARRPLLVQQHRAILMELPGLPQERRRPIVFELEDRPLQKLLKQHLRVAEEVTHAVLELVFQRRQGIDRPEPSGDLRRVADNGRNRRNWRPTEIVEGLLEGR